MQLFINQIRNVKHLCRVVVFSLLLGLILVLPGYSLFRADQEPNANSVSTLTIGTTMDVKGINIDDYYFGIMRGALTHLGLVAFDEPGNYTGALAESWESQDAQIWTFKLKPGITWHDGQPVTAADVAFSLEYLPAKIPVYQSHFQQIETVEAPDDQTVIVKLSEPNARILANLVVLRTLPKHIFASIDKPKEFNDKQATIGCGPYIFESFDEAAGVLTFRANENYYRGTPNIQQIKFRLFKNPDTMYLALQKGEIDLPYFYAAGTDPLYAANLTQSQDIKLHLIENQGIPNALFFNTQKPPVDSPRFREALSYAIDYPEMLRLFGAGYGSIPQAGFVPQGTPGFIETRQLTYAPDQAKQILDELGYQDRNQDGVREKDGQPLELEIVVRNDIAENARIADLLKQNLAAVGVKLNVKVVDTTVFRTISDVERSHVSLLTRTTAWGMMMWGGYGSGYLDARNIGWCMVTDPAFQALVDKMILTLDQEQYKKEAAAYQRYIAERLPVIPLYWNTLIQPYNTRFEGWQVDPMYGFLNEGTWFSLRQVQ
ncbi:MAG: ABC transporter substrate-binding protein [Bacillota bacterium]|jgi:peptide/nickel transport system substrate-binding protein